MIGAALPPPYPTGAVPRTADDLPRAYSEALAAIQPQRGRPGPGMTPPTRPSGVEAALQQLGNQQQAAGKLLDELEGMLEGVLAPVTAATPAPDAPSASCPIASKVVDHAIVAQGLVVRLQSLLSRVAL